MTSTPTFAHSSLLVAVGGGFGAWLRHLTGRAWLALAGPASASAFPWATLTCNLAGSLAMGLLVGWLARHGTGGESTRLLLGVGVLGGYTTFSSFSLEAVMMLERRAYGTFAAYVAGSVTISILALMLGLFLMRKVVP